MVNSLLRLENVETYYGPILAIQGIDLEVAEGAIVTLLGANGAGKTTVMRTISGALNPQQGRIVFDGKEIQSRDPDWVARQGIAHVPEGREVFPLLSVRKNLLLGAYRRHDRAGIQRDLALIYGYFPILQERAKQKAGFLSGGEQQMLAIGRALMSQPRLMLLDEPSLGLSPRLVTEIFAIIRRLNEEQGVTVLLVEQNARKALRIAQYGYVLALGRVIMHDPSERLLVNDTIRESYLGITD